MTRLYPRRHDPRVAPGLRRTPEPRGRPGARHESTTASAYHLGHEIGVRRDAEEDG